MDDTHAIEVRLRDTGAGGAFEDDYCRQRKLSPSRGIAELLNEPVRRACPIPPPSSGAGPDDIGGLDHEHASEIRASDR